MRFYQFAAAPSPRPLEPLRVHTTKLGGQLMGLLSDPPSAALGRPTWNHETKMLHHVGSVTKCLLNGQLRAVADVPANALTDLTGLVMAAPTSTTTVVVDGDVTPARTLRLNDLDFALADDLDVDYYVIARLAGSLDPWPALLVSPRASRQ